MITGTAADRGLGLSEVRVYPSPCERLIVTGTPSWSLTLSNVPPGTNAVEVESIDRAGNRSAILRRVFFRVLPTLVGITNDGTGSGTITGLKDKQLVEIGRNYPISAKAASGSLFAGWKVERISLSGTNTTTNSFFSDLSSLLFRAESNITFTATFVTNPFPQLKGTYVGLLYHTNFFLAHDRSGALRFTLTEFGKFSGAAQFGNKSYPFSGTFHPATGKASISFKGPGGTTLRMDPVRLDLTNQQETINGVIGEINTWSSFINAYRVRTGTTAHPSPFKGSYTWMVPGEAMSTHTPAGDSFGRFTVSKTGTVSLSGTMADGTPVTAGAPIGTNGVWGLRAPLYSGLGSILSWVTVDTTRTNEDLFGTFYWFHPLLPKAKFYTNSFTVTTTITGSRYIAPVGSTNRVLTNFVGDGVLALTDGNLPGPQTNVIALRPNNTLTNQSTNKLTFVLTNSTGLFSGTVAPTNQAKAITYKGVILQKQGFGAGFHLDTNRSGRIYIGP